jgi:hypothetical protein
MQRSRVAVSILSFLIAVPGAMAAATCATSGKTVQCSLPTSASSIDLNSVLASAQAVNSGITTKTTMVLVAFGGTGGNGNDSSGQQLGIGGTMGMAQMATTLSAFSSKYSTTTIYYYLGTAGSTEHDGGKGASATIVSTANLSSTAATTANVLLIGGGGGGGASATSSAPGGWGGAGGVAVSSVGSAVSKAGTSGTGKGGAGGNNGLGGAGGSSNLASGRTGNNGIGGQGGPVHLSNGPSTLTVWANVSGVPSGIGTNGAGGEGEWRSPSGISSTSMPGEGGGGGGGYGGGGGGGASDGSSLAGGGGGGGSYAAASTVQSNLTLTTPSPNGSVIIVFTPN